MILQLGMKTDSQVLPDLLRSAQLPSDQYGYKLVPIFYGEGDLETLMKDQLVRSAKAEIAAEKSEQERASIRVSR